MLMTRRAAVKTLAVSSVAAVGGTGLYGYLVGRHQLEVTRTSLPVPGLPHSLVGLRIGLVTDIHRSASVSHEDVMRAVFHPPGEGKPE